MSHETVVKKARRRPLFVPGPTSTEVSLARTDIERMIPHRGSMLLVDNISAVDLPQLSMQAHRRLDPADPVFAGHFPGNPVYPGALLLESMGQAALCLHHLLEAGRAEVRPDDQPRPVRLLKVLHALFQSEARPGDALTLLCRRLEEDSYTMTCAAQALLGDTICAVTVLEVYLVED